MNRIFLTPILLATAALAGPYDQPYAQIQTERHFPSADPLVIPVIVNRIDGENATNKGAVAPGMHEVTLDVPPRKGFHTATQNTFQLEAKPCVRYYVAARLKSRTLQEWTPIVRSEERLRDCEAKFHVAGAQ
ncbi:MAG TPA: hypothetical protein VLL50_04985 [Usitatibacter sp.]|jgi:hypothetical protein|nr:hypothetical protein [Usitatibacter sp.]